MHILLNFFAFFLREKSWHSNQTNGILSSIDRKSLRDSNKWTSVGPGSFHMKKTMWAWAYYIYTINGILFQKIFWPTVRKSCCSDRENFLKFKQWKVRTILVTEYFYNLFLEVSQNSNWKKYSDLERGLFRNMQEKIRKFPTGFQVP